MRSDDPYTRQPSSASPGRDNDPLAELARLIGQDDQFGGTGRASAQARTPAPQPRAVPRAAAPEWQDRTPAGDDSGHDHHDYMDEAPETDPRHRAAAPYAEPAYRGEERYEEPRYETEGDAYAAGAYAPEEYYDDGQYGEEGYEEPAPEKRRGGLMIIAAVVGLVVLGSAGVYGYRAMTGPSAAGGEPPVIRADQTPTKVVPTPPVSDTQAAKPYDRVGDRGGERMVPREEQPVDPNALRPSAGPGATAPSTASVLPPLPAQGQPAAVPMGGEPKKVKTIPIRPDQPVAPQSSPPQMAPQQPRALAAPPAAPPAAAPPAAAPPAAAPPAAAPTRMANVPPPAPAAPASNNYVQVSSQTSEADAQASWKALQAKYPAQLSDQRATIVRVDVAGIGIRYRAMVGPFGSRDEANQFCTNFKSAGGKCIPATN